MHIKSAALIKEKQGNQILLRLTPKKMVFEKLFQVKDVCLAETVKNNKLKYVCELHRHEDMR